MSERGIFRGFFKGLEEIGGGGGGRVNQIGEGMGFGLVRWENRGGGADRTERPGTGRQIGTEEAGVSGGGRIGSMGGG